MFINVSQIITFNCFNITSVDRKGTGKNIVPLEWRGDGLGHDEATSGSLFSVLM